MKKYLALFGLAALIGCSQDTSASDSNKEEQPSPQDLEDQLREEAIPLEFAFVNAGEVEGGEKVSIQGTISAEETSDEGTAFTVTTKEESGYGSYTVEKEDEDAEYTVQDIVEVYGTYRGTDEAGTPVIEGTIIEGIK
ncbi:hypothetical protein GCM10010954_28450 [Halobacillus andaensis]|uniref:Lipoprotein n=1 Tax=Halobacillus andaensis TaxID=1176239 RepID=A0A917EXP2_HALAA|nr:hypothetical protein [Halobacillus andaensis]MBP2006477.1 hypothetical protein [Halobacillus andaensis]GGF27657.1 hypothetical protein GCM10010954_28450 [Halobacillus andaensis]